MGTFFFFFLLQEDHKLGPEMRCAKVSMRSFCFCNAVRLCCTCYAVCCKLLEVWIGRAQTGSAAASKSVPSMRPPAFIAPHRREERGPCASESRGKGAKNKPSHTTLYSTVLAYTSLKRAGWCGYACSYSSLIQVYCS